MIFVVACLCNALGTSNTKVEDDFYPDHTFSAAFADADGSLDDAPHTCSDLEPIPERESEPEQEDEGDGKSYSLKEVIYAIPPSLENLAKPPPRQGGGEETAEIAAEVQDCDYSTRMPRKSLGRIYGVGAMAGGGMLGGEIAG
jgi:hypothetical protein